MSELTAAAERLSDVYKTGDGCRVYGCPPDEAVERMRDDEVALLRAWLDPTPIDADWLRSVGFEAAGFKASPSLQLGILRCWESGDEWSIRAGSHYASIPSPQTRGDVRRLASVLGLSLAEKETNDD